MDANVLKMAPEATSYQADTQRPKSQSLINEREDLQPFNLQYGSEPPRSQDPGGPAFWPSESNMQILETRELEQLVRRTFPPSGSSLRKPSSARPRIGYR